MWKIITEFPNYAVNEYGQVKNILSDRILKSNGGKSKGVSVILHNKNLKKTLSVHRLVGKYFIANPNNQPCINHKDENMKNNCASNLEWCSYKYNSNYGTKNIRMIITRNKNHSYGCEKSILQLNTKGVVIKVFKSISQASKELKLDTSNIWKACKGYRTTCGGFIFKYKEE